MDSKITSIVNVVVVGSLLQGFRGAAHCRTFASDSGVPRS
jgi:hypothetical protein